MSVRSIEAEVSIKSGVEAECTIGREVIVEVHDEAVLEPLTVTTNGTYEPSEGIDGYDRVVVDVPPTIPEIEALTVTEDGTYTASGDGYNPVTVNTGVGALRQEIASAETASGCSPLTEGLTALTTYANEVTGQEDETLSDAVETLASKYGKAEFNLFAYLTTCNNLFNNNGALPESITIDFENNIKIGSYSAMFANSKGTKRITIKNAVITNTMGNFCRNTSIETLIFENCTLSPTSMQDFAYNSAGLRKIDGEFDLTNCTNISAAFNNNGAYFEDVRFKQNTLSINIPINFFSSADSITDETFISLGNALVEDTKTATFRDNHKRRINTILGNNDNGTFVADENGSMTLMDFITTVKGWTVT